MSAKLKDFLVNLASDVEVMARYTSDPEGELDRAGLTPEEKAAVMAHNAERIRRALGASGVDHLTQIGRPPKLKKPRPRPKPGKKTGGRKGAKKGGKKR